MKTTFERGSTEGIFIVVDQLTILYVTIVVCVCVQVPTACKACPCGFRFRKALGSETVSGSGM